MKKLKILIVNLDNIEFTRDCLKDLQTQTSDDFEIVLVDQASTEEGTSEFLNSITYDNVEIVRNSENMPLNHVWSWFHATYKNEYLCFLNNDINLCSNFVESTIAVFEKEPYVGIVVHSTNHMSYCTEQEQLNYKVVEPFVNMQGWDFSLRHALFPTLPNYIKTYCGDDFIFHSIYERGFNLAYVLNSPIIHYEGQSKKSMKTSGVEDIRAYIDNNNPHYLKPNFEYSNLRPTFFNITKTNAMSNRITELYNVSLVNPNVTQSIDIYEHMPVLKRYGEECKHITEMGVRWGASTLAFIMANPERLISYDIQSTHEIEQIMAESTQLLNHSFVLADTLNLTIEPTELLFIDTLHTYNQLVAELRIHEGNVSKYIILHDTTTFGRVDEQIYQHASELVKGQSATKTGLRTAMEDFLAENTNWSILEDLTNNNGLTILKRNE